MVRAAIAALALALPATAHAATSFSGRCDLSGAVAFRPAMTNAPQPITQRARAAGTCTGTLVDAAGRRHELAGAPVAYAATSFAPAGSCLGGTAEGRGTLFFAYGRLRFALSETRASALPLLTLRGARSGAALAVVTPSPSQDPVAALAACAGDGLRAFAFDGRLLTTPGIAG